MRRRLRVCGLLLGTLALAIQAPAALTSVTSAGAATPPPAVHRMQAAAMEAVAPTVASVTARNWADRHKMAMNSQHAGGAVLGGRLYVVGGQVYHEPLRLVQSYYPSKNLSLIHI